MQQFLLPPLRHPTVTIEALKVMLINYEQMGFSIEELLLESGIDTSCLENNHHHISPLVFGKVFKAGIRITGDPLLGLHIGDQSNLDALGIVGQLYRYSKNIREGSIQISKYLPVFHTLFTYGVKEDDRHFSIVFSPNADSNVHKMGSKQLIDLALAYNRQGIRHATQSALNPAFVTIQYNVSTAVIKHYEEVLQCEIRTNCAENQLVYEKSAADIVHVFDNPTLIAGLEKFAGEELDRIYSVGPYTTTVKNILLENLRDGIAPVAKKIAAKVGLSISSLKRLLAGENTSYRQICESLQQSGGATLHPLNSAQEKERSRIARELHDGVSGLLAAAKMHFSIIQEKLQDFKEASEYVTALSLLDDASSEVRKTAYNLMPEILLQYGIHEALLRYCRNIGYGNTKVVYSCLQKPERYDDTFELGVYRIAQELIHNAIKHGMPNKIEVELLADNGLLNLQVADNGHGFDLNKVKKGIGLDSVKERVVKLGGDIKWESHLNQGTKVNLTFNLKHAERAYQRSNY